jgi:hypothetical protein
VSPEQIRASSLAAAETYFEAFAAGDMEKVANVLADDVVHTLAMSFDGGVEPGLVFTGKDEVLGFFSGILGRTSRRGLFDRRTTASATATSSSSKPSVMPFSQTRAPLTRTCTFSSSSAPTRR